jgi:hypothetical protein
MNGMYYAGSVNTRRARGHAVASGPCHEHVLSFCASVEAIAQSGHAFGLSRIALRNGASIDRLHLQAPRAQSKVVSNQGPQQTGTCLQRTVRMAIAEQTTMVQTVLAARGYRLEVLTRLVESPVDYLGSALATTQVSEGWFGPTLRHIAMLAIVE